MDSLLI